MRKIGVFGGSFNPVHLEHINIARAAIDVFSLDHLIVVPTYVSPHKKNLTLAPAADRLNMLKLAFAEQKDVSVSDHEITEGGVSFTYKTLEHFKNVENAEYYLLLGADMLADFPSWKEPEKILKIAKPIVTPRENENLSKALTVFYDAFKARPLVSLYVGKDVSSTEIRNRITLGLNVSDFLDERVAKYIKKHGLYSDSERKILADYVRKSLNPKRLVHTVGVMTLAQKYALRLGVDVDKASLAAMLHDVAKYKTYEEFGLTAPAGVPKNVLHQFLGEYVCRNVLSVKDEDVLSAVRYHSTGRAKMSVLEKIVFTADLLEKNRTFKGVDELREAVDKDFDSGFALCVQRLVEYLHESGIPASDIYYLTEECREYYCGQKSII